MYMNLPPSVTKGINRCVFSVVTLHLCPSLRCMAEGLSSIPLEHYMKENSKTTCTTAQEHTLSQTALLTKVTFTRTGKKAIYFLHLLCHFFNVEALT